MRIGIVCPYALDVPGGVQVHVTDLAQELMRRGHEVGVLAPAGPENGATLPGLPVPVNAIPIPYNGSVARLNFGAARQCVLAAGLSKATLTCCIFMSPLLLQSVCWRYKQHVARW